LSLRTRGQGQRPFTVIETLQREAEARYRGEEQQLREKLEETEARLQEMQAQEGAAEAQEEALQRFTDELLATRQQLRDVTFELRKDIEALETRITLINVAAVPAGVAILAMLLGLARLRRRSRAA
jgi:chromosome segregation ATPase